MKKTLMAAGALACFGVGGVVGVLASSGTPEIDRAAAKISLTGSIKPVQCVGEDKGQYDTWSGSYSGSESQVLPDPTDYNLSSSSVSISGITWTIHQGTGSTTVNRGVFTGTITLSSAAGGAIYRGFITLITQGFPAAGGPAVPARGWINAKFVGADDGVPNTSTNPNDDNLLANVEFKLTPTAATGQFGSAVPSLGFPDFSAVTNVAPVAQDGHC